jgi:hypothetical protein
MFTLIEYMPVHLRASHLAAGNAGIYPHNGAKRVWVTGDCRPAVDHLDERWASVVRVAARLPDGETTLIDIPAEAMGGLEY